MQDRIEKVFKEVKSLKIELKMLKDKMRGKV